MANSVLCEHLNSAPYETLFLICTDATVSSMFRQLSQHLYPKKLTFFFIYVDSRIAFCETMTKECSSLLKGIHFLITTLTGYSEVTGVTIK